MNRSSIISRGQALQILANELRRAALERRAAELQEAAPEKRAAILGAIERGIRNEIRRRAKLAEHWNVID